MPLVRGPSAWEFIAECHSCHRSQKSWHLYIQDDTWFPFQGLSPIPAATSMQLALCEWNAACRNFRSCSADPRSWSGDFFLHDWHSLYHSGTSGVISTESDQRPVTHFSLSSSKWTCKLKNVGRIHCTSGGSLRVFIYKAHLVTIAIDFKKPVGTLMFLIWKLINKQ